MTEHHSYLMYGNNFLCMNTLSELKRQHSDALWDTISADKDKCFDWNSSLQGFVKTSLGKHDPESFLQGLVDDGILEEPVLGKLRFTYKDLNLKGEKENMKED